MTSLRDSMKKVPVHLTWMLVYSIFFFHHCILFSDWHGKLITII